MVMSLLNKLTVKPTDITNTNFSSISQATKLQKDK